jgi:nitrogen fixation protein FixH
MTRIITGQHVTERKFTGWHMLAWMVTFFGVVIAVNITMARIAIGSFGGTVVDNSYVASQQFNGWLEQARTQQELGWQVQPSLSDDRHLQVSVTGARDPLAVTAMARHPLGTLPDMALTFRRLPDGRFVARDALPGGRWIVRLQVVSGDQVWRQEQELQ